MVAKTNSKTIRSILTENLKRDGKILKELSTLLGFVTAASSGEPLSILAGLKLISKTAGAAISAASEIAELFFKGDEIQADKREAFSGYEKFRVLFYIASFRCYLEGIQEVLEEIESYHQNDIKTAVSKTQKELLYSELKEMINAFEESEVSFLFC